MMDETLELVQAVSLSRDSLQQQLSDVQTMLKNREEEKMSSSSQLKELGDTLSAISEERDSLTKVKEQLENDIAVTSSKLVCLEEHAEEKNKKILELEEMLKKQEDSIEDMSNQVCTKTEEMAIQEK